MLKTIFIFRIWIPTLDYHYIDPVNFFFSESSPKPRIVYTPNGDQILELTIETLMGTTFEVRLPAKTLVASIKNRFQRSEGVPRHHLHIIHGGKYLFSGTHIHMIYHRYLVLI